MTVLLTHEIYLFWGVQLFAIALAGVLSAQGNVLFMLIAAEIGFLSANALFVIFSMFFQDLNGQVFTLFVLAVSAAEAAVGLAIFILYYKLHGTIAYPFINLIKG